MIILIVSKSWISPQGSTRYIPMAGSSTLEPWLLSSAGEGSCPQQFRHRIIRPVGGRSAWAQDFQQGAVPKKGWRIHLFLGGLKRQGLDDVWPNIETIEKKRKMKYVRKRKHEIPGPRPCTSMASSMAPFERSSSATEQWLKQAAQCNGLRPQHRKPTGRTVDGFQGDLERNLLWKYLDSNHIHSSISSRMFDSRVFESPYIPCIFYDLVVLAIVED